MPGFWEKRQAGPFMTVTEVIADANFKPKKVIFLNGGKMPDYFHALFVAQVSDIIVRAIRVNSTIKFEVYAIINIRESGPNKFVLLTELVAESDDLTVLAEQHPDTEFENLLNAAKDKLDIERTVSVYTFNELDFDPSKNK